ncbi:MAG: site-2 protease family protein [Candidatus Kapaibacterium sp.]
MSENTYSEENQARPHIRMNKLWIHIGLFALTFLSCMMAGAQWAFKDFTEITNWHYGLTYAILIMTFLSAHEFAHYAASRLHGVDASLPFFIPLPIPYIVNFGTLGAVIKTRSRIPSRRALFDIGVSGPIAGFIVCFGFLLYGLATLPPIDYLYNIHPEYLENGGKIPETSLFFGDTLLYWIMTELFANPDGFLPPMNEIYHYPFLNVGWFGLFVTTLNMLPLGQLDGGHVTYAMFGRRNHAKIARVVWWAMVAIGCGSLLGLIHESLQVDSTGAVMQILRAALLPPLSWIADSAPFIFRGWGGWLFWALITRVFIKLDHPPVGASGSIGRGRMTLGWIALVILLMSFSYNGIYYIEP